jgi:hypothetical protein
VRRRERLETNRLLALQQAAQRATQIHAFEMLAARGALEPRCKPGIQ